MKISLKNLKRKVLFVAVSALALLCCLVQYGFCSTGSDMTSAITEWLPIILQFAIIGMIFGMLKKFGKW